MITHIVLFKLKDRTASNIEKTRDILIAMKWQVPKLRHIEVGVDLLHTERSYDIALVTKFDSLQDMEFYQTHPFHLDVAKYMSSVRESAISVDYETN